jgi:phage terminase large subunit-like protein
VGDSLLKRAVNEFGIERLLELLDEEQRSVFGYEWSIHARPEQLPPPGNWRVWLILAGRGWGKTKTGAEWVRQFAYEHPGCLIALIARTAADVRTTMLEGPSGLLSISPPWFYPNHEASKCKLTWPNGSVALHFSAEEPKGLRGPQFNGAWCDELASWSSHMTEDEKGLLVKGIPTAWTQLQFTMRIPGKRPQILVTTTPRAVKVIRDLVADPETVTIGGSTFDNADNLSPEFIQSVKRLYEGTRLGQQELYGRILTDTPGALWTISMLENCRVQEIPPDLNRVVIGLDPSGGRGERGIVSAAIAPCTCKGQEEIHGFVISDASGVYGPDTWGRAVIAEYNRWQADRIIVERNFGGDMASALLRTVDSMVSITEVVASRGKAIRAEPVAALYEQGKVHHVGDLTRLEDQMCTWTPDTEEGSPDRLDALVWALSSLMIKEGAGLDAWGLVDMS